LASDASVLIHEEGGVGWFTLNRPRALNALNLDMIRLLSPQLEKMAANDGVRIVVIRGAGEKAFCAGGDIRAITEVPGGSVQRDFFNEEYRLDLQVGNYPLPYVAILNGITMGGGVGISVNGRWRVAMKKTVFAMPETGIGLLPDVGGGFFLPRLEGELGMFLGLTGHRLKGWDCFKSGVATHAVMEDKLDELDGALAALAANSQIPQTELPGQVEALLGEFTPLEAREHIFSLSDQMEMINRVFSASSVEDILKRLEAESNPLADKATKAIKSASPTSLKVAFRQIRQGREMNRLEEVLIMEHRLVNRCCEDKDFYEGVRALLIDKDNKPNWNPSSLEEVTEEKLDWYFSPLENDRELVF